MDAAVVLGVTATELHVWSADIMLGQVDDHLGAVPRSEIAAVEVGIGKSWQPLTLRLQDGHTIEVQARGGVHQFVGAFD